MEDYYSNRNSAVRVMLGKVDDSKTEQYVDVEGLGGEQFTEVLRIQSHGFTSHPPADSHALGIPLGHKRDQLLILGGENPAKRPKDIGLGDSAFYNADGTIWKMIGKTATLDAAESVTITTDKLVLKCGATTVTISAEGVKIEGGKVTHDGKDIGKTHRHLNTQPGSGQSGQPA